jgi:beta-galactosidase
MNAGFLLSIPGIALINLQLFLAPPALCGAGRSSIREIETRSGPVREKLLMDFGWKFHLGNAASDTADFGFGTWANFAKAGEGFGPQSPDFNDSLWRTLDLPHDWAVELGFVQVENEAVKDHGYKPVGRMFPANSVGWYRKAFSVPASDDGRRVHLHFDGAFRESIVWLNGHYLGRNTTGYGEFDFDVSDYLQYGKRNTLVVRVDATQYEGWFYEGAGIYRHVWLEKWQPLNIREYGTYISTTVDRGKRKATVRVETQIQNEGVDDVEARLALRILDKTGKIVGSGTSKVVRVGTRGSVLLQQNIAVDNPLLWSLDRPNLYTLVSILRSGNRVSDSLETNFGIRTIRFDKDKGFFLNDVPVKIQGVCCHQDHAGVGAALPDRLQYYRIERLKEMGCNAYRTSHNPPTRELLEACDRLGMLVLDENRLMGTTSEMMANFERLILRDRNHPSVFLWSIGNEEWMVQDGPVGKRFAQAMLRRQKEVDPSRLCTYAANNGSRFAGINSVIDIRGINYIRLGNFDAYRREHPEQIILGSEEASTLCTRGIHAIDTLKGYMSDYDVSAPGWGLTAEQWWPFYADREWLAGAFVWTGFDYRGEPTPYRWPCISSHFGIMDVCGFPKNNFYYYQSWWSRRDVLHLAPHWNWQGREGQLIDVWCQSNCDSVELLLNGRSLGWKPMRRNSHLEWKVSYAPGELAARGKRGGRTIETSVATTGTPHRLRMEADRDTILADGEDCSVITVSALDGEGREVPVADNLVQFELQGEGRIIGVGNGDPSCHEADKYLPGGWKRSLFNGKCQVIVQTGFAPERLVLRAESNGLVSALLAIEARQAAGRLRAE